MKNLFKFFTIIFSLFFITACGTLFSGSTQTINIKVVENNTQTELQNINCVLTEPNGNMQTFSNNPTIITIARGSGNLRIDCKKAGYTQLNMAVGDSFNSTTILNVLFWPGFIVDIASGAHKKYPSHYIISMQKN